MDLTTFSNEYKKKLIDYFSPSKISTKLEFLPTLTNPKYITYYDDFFSNPKIKLFFNSYLNTVKNSYINISINSFSISEYPHKVYSKDTLMFIKNFTLLYKDFKKIDNTNLYRLRTELFIFLLLKIFPSNFILTNILNYNSPKEMKFLNKGSYGKIFYFDFGIAFKVNISKSSDIFYEEFIGKFVCNKIINKYHIPNLIYTFGILEKGDLKEIHSFGDEYLKNTILNSSNGLLIENIPNTLNFHDFLNCEKARNFSLKDFKEIFIQILLTINLLFDENNFCHNDLHNENVLIYELEKDDEKNKLYTYPMNYGSEYVLKNKPKYFPRIIDYGSASCVFNNKLYAPYNLRESFIPHINNDIYKFCLSCFHSIYHSRYIKKSEGIKILNYLFDTILNNRFISERNFINIIENYKELIFKRTLIPFYLEGDSHKNLITSFLKDFKQDKKIKIDRKTTEPEILDLKSKLSNISAFINSFIFSFKDLSYIKNYIDENDLFSFLKNYNKENLIKYYKSEKYIKKIEQDEIKSFIYNFSVIEKLTENNLDDYIEIMGYYEKEFGNKINKEKFWKWYLSVDGGSKASPLNFYLINIRISNKNIPIGFVGFKPFQIYNKYNKGFLNEKEIENIEDIRFVEIYLYKFFLGKNMGSSIFYAGINRLLNDLNKIKINVYASIFCDNKRSINFFEKIGFEFYKDYKNIVILRKNNIERIIE